MVERNIAVKLPLPRPCGDPHGSLAGSFNSVSLGGQYDRFYEICPQKWSNAWLGVVSTQWQDRIGELDGAERKHFGFLNCRRWYTTNHFRQRGEVKVRIDNRDKDKKKNKKKESTFEAEIFRIMEKSLKSALDVALDDIFKDWK